MPKVQITLTLQELW